MPLKQILLIAVFLGLVFSVAFLLFSASKNPFRGSSTLLGKNIFTLPNQEKTYFGLPVRLKIPVIKVDSVIIPVGLTSDGAMDVPKSPDEAAWFNLGSRPGENGTAVIAGHYGWKNNIPAVFDDLYKLDIGDKIFVEDEKGADVTFVVREIKVYGKDEIVPGVFSSGDGKPHLNLITCSGSWNEEEKTRPERLVIFADRE